MKLKRVLSLLLAMVMTVSLLTLPVHAEGNDFASLTVAEQYAALKSADNEAEAQALFDTLTEQQQTALVTYAQTQAEQEYTVPQTVVFTEAGPFMPPVNVAPVRMKTMARAAAAPAEDDNGLVFEKKAKANGNGTYTITMEAYTTGEVTTSTKTVPVDIVLVLDQSGSMAYDFNGNSTGTNSARRQYAMKQAVNNFILAVNEKYSAEADHRMAIVTFGSSASTLQGWTYVDETGKTALQGKISRLPNSPSGATNVAAGMQQAETLMGSGYSYNGSNTTRQKVVIVFTDGVPTTDSDFDTTVATNAISSAKKLKDAGATVYTVGIFNGANPSELYGASGFDTNSDGSIGSEWIMDTWGLFPGTDFPEADRPAGNRFLNYLSSNYPDATSIGLNRSTRGLGILHYKITYKITYNSTIAASNYYLTANDSTSLNNIFQTISQNIQTANIDLGSKTVIKDIISPYFTAPANASDIHLYTAAAKSDGTFENRVAAPNTVKPTVTGDTVSVTGFNFNDNFVSDKVKSDGTYGKKLIIEFTVTPKAGFLGGNDVTTNASAGIYENSSAQTPVRTFDQPEVNVPIKDVTVTAKDKNVYLLGGLTAAQLKEGAMVKVGDVTLNLAPDATNYGLEAWQTAYVNITVEVKDKGGNVITTDLTDLTDDTTYTVEVTVAPKTQGTSTPEKGDAATAKTGVNNPAANIYVFKPEVTFKDSTAYYGETVPANNDYSGNRVGAEKWMHDGTEAVLSEMLGTKPTLDISYTPDTNKIADGKYTKQDVPVKATVKIGSEDVTQYTTFVHQNCTTDCGWETPTTPGDPAFLLHVKTCTLTITKTGCDTDKDANQSFIFNVTGGAIAQNMQVTVQENGRATIVGLPVGSYTVTEVTSWSWRYNPDSQEETVNVQGGPDNTVSFHNTRTATKWLSGDNYAVNHEGCIKPRGTFVGSN